MWTTASNDLDLVFWSGVASSRDIHGVALSRHHEQGFESHF